MTVGGIAHAQTAGYDVILLVGQSNMVGYGTGPDNADDAAVSPRVFQLDGNGNIIPAQDPLVMVMNRFYVGPGLTFGKAYARQLPANRSVLLVGAAVGGTGFYTGDWKGPNGPLAMGAVARANTAMAAAGAGARFAGILWHQGETDATGTDAVDYAPNLTGLIVYLRSAITGASTSTPFVVGELNYNWMYEYLYSGSAAANSLYSIIYTFHTIVDPMPNMAWVSTAGLTSDASTGEVHFSALAQRQLGRRYADKFFEASSGLPQPEVSMKSWAGAFIDDGRSYPGGPSQPVNNPGTVSGNIAIVTDPIRGNVARISQGAGKITYQVPASTFNASYTKMAWFQPGATGYYNNLVSAHNPGQAHFLFASSNSGSVFIGAGHSDGNSTPVQIGVQVPATAGVWMNIAEVYNASQYTMTLYVNGVQVATQGGIAPAPSISGVVPVVMGGYGTVGGGVDGEMGGNRAWNVALTPAQIAAIYGYEVGYRAGF